MISYKLKIDPAGRAPSSSDGVRTAETWRDVDDRICAVGFVAGDRYWIRLPRLGTFGFDASSRDVIAIPSSGTPTVAIREAYRRSVLPLVMQVQGREVLHASSVLCRRGSVAFCGRSGAGKSTIAYGLSRRGYRQWADDTVAIERVNGEIRTFATPFGIRLRQDPARYFGRPAKDSTRIRITAPRKAGRSARLCAVFVLDQRRESSARRSSVQIRRLAPSEFFGAVLPHAYCFSLGDPERKRRMIRHYLEFGSEVPTFRVRFASKLVDLPIVLDAIERVVERL